MSETLRVSTPRVRQTSGLTDTPTLTPWVGESVVVRDTEDSQFPLGGFFLILYSSIVSGTSSSSSSVSLRDRETGTERDRERHRQEETEREGPELS